jgi:hypothetical protein
VPIAFRKLAFPALGSVRRAFSPRHQDKTGNRALFVGEDRREKQAEILT